MLRGRASLGYTIMPVSADSCALGLVAGGLIERQRGSVMRDGRRVQSMLTPARQAVAAIQDRVDRIRTYL
jgi:hypothetical protein